MSLLKLLDELDALRGSGRFTDAVYFNWPRISAALREIVEQTKDSSEFVCNSCGNWTEDERIQKWLDKHGGGN